MVILLAIGDYGRSVVECRIIRVKTAELDSTLLTELTQLLHPINCFSLLWPGLSLERKTFIT